MYILRFLRSNEPIEFAGIPFKKYFESAASFILTPSGYLQYKSVFHFSKQSEVKKMFMLKAFISTVDSENQSLRCNNGCQKTCASDFPIKLMDSVAKIVLRLDNIRHSPDSRSYLFNFCRANSNNTKCKWKR